MIPRLLLFIVGLCMGYPSLVWADDAAPLHRHEEAVQGQGRLQEALQRSYERSPIFRLEEAERDKIVRFRLKPDVKRGNRKAVRLEMSGPEGFMIGFDQYKWTTRIIRSLSKATEAIVGTEDETQGRRSSLNR